MESLVDNDVLIKGSCYLLLDELLAKAMRPVGILGAAQFVVPKRIEARNLNAGSTVAIQHFRDFVASSMILEPTENEQKLAAELERVAQVENLALDAGESQLCAILIERTAKRLYTGDKRAIQSMERMLDSTCDLLDLCGKVTCLEQLFVDAVSESTIDRVRSAVCSEPETDTAIRMCFSCNASEILLDSVIAGLESYVNALRVDAPRILAK